MIKHRGKLVQEAIKSKGFSYNFVAEKLGITRSYLHKCLKKEDLSIPLINKISNIICYDFREILPEIYEESNITENPPYHNKRQDQTKVIKNKYANLVDHYNSLLKFLLDLANNYDIEDLKKEIKEHLKKQT